MLTVNLGVKIMLDEENFLHVNLIENLVGNFVVDIQVEGICWSQIIFVLTEWSFTLFNGMWTIFICGIVRA